MAKPKRKPPISMRRRADRANSSPEMTSLEHTLAQAEQQARELLATDGLSPDGKVLIWPDGSAVECPNTFAETQALLAERGTGLAQIKTRLALIAERDDINAGAARGLMHVQALRHALAWGDAAQAAWWALRFGCEALMLEQECKGWPQAIAAGMGTSRGGHIGGLAKRDRDPAKVAVKAQVVEEARRPAGRRVEDEEDTVGRKLWPAKHRLNPSTVRDWLKGMPKSGG